MMSASDYRWPAKLKKFGIADPFLMVLATKYEREIPWQIVVKDEKTLSGYVEGEMFPRLLAQTTYPPDKMSRNLFVSRDHVNLDTALQYQHDLNEDELSHIEKILKTAGEVAATDALVEKINKRKAQAFMAWINHLQKRYPSEPAFWLLLLRPVFELTGRGARRDLFTPSQDIIEWLHRRISRGRLLPNENLARQYCMKAGAGSDTKRNYGWSYVPSGSRNSARLAALSRGSGWCVAGQRFAGYYLCDSEFYILYSNGKPEVALRLIPDSKVIEECQGRHNFSPEAWFHDIQLFVETRDLRLQHRANEMNRALRASGNLDLKPMDWWRERIRLWPFGVFFAPRQVRDTLMPDLQISAIHYTEFKDFNALRDLVGLPPDLGLDEAYWVQLIEMNPNLYVEVPEKHKGKSAIREACINGWLEKLENDDITSKEMGSIPEFVSEQPQFLDTLRENFPSALRARIRKLRSTRVDRENPFRLDKALPIIPDEHADLVVERMVNILLNGEDGSFSDDKFTDIIRTRKDFRQLRVVAWQSGIKAEPPLWFALPHDLKEREEFLLTEEAPGRVDLPSWVEKVMKKPWLLTQKDGVTKGVRLHPQILDAYREGWRRYLRVSPWRIWVKRGVHRRVYMSYALLTDETVIQALTQGWEAVPWDELSDAWANASPRMRHLPALQVSILRAIDKSTKSLYAESCLGVLRDIWLRHNRKAAEGRIPDTPFKEEIQAHVQAFAGLITARTSGFD